MKWHRTLVNAFLVVLVLDYFQITGVHALVGIVIGNVILSVAGLHEDVQKHNN